MAGTAVVTRDEEQVGADEGSGRMPKIVDVLRRLVRNVSSYTGDGLPLLRQHISYDPVQLDIAIASWRLQYLASDPRQRDPRSLNLFEHKVYSQDGTDGILREVFRRVGEAPRHFVEFGAGNGLENNTTFLVVQGWAGLWIDGHEERVEQARQTFAEPVDAGRLTILREFITKDNIEQLFCSAHVPQEPSVISIDIDGNDYWVFEALSSFRPMVFVVEYNAMFPPDASWVMSHNPLHEWRTDSYQGASLKALTDLAARKGYTLIACSLAGINSFFLRDDLISEKFISGTPSDFYHPPHYFAIHETAGHARAFGPGESGQSAHPQA